MSSLRRLCLVLALLCLPSMVVACAETPKPQAFASADLAVNDPLEPMNRVIFDVNDFLDRLLVKPLTELYRFAVPDFVRERVANILSNMDEPVVLVNNVLQGETESAGITLGRFLLNTTVGLGGSFEVADELELAKQRGDFGQTLSAWGVNAGPYLVLPLLGPTNFRDAIGLGVDTLMSPWQYVVSVGDATAEDTFLITSTVAKGLTRREEVLDEYEALRSGALDFYAEMRSIYIQYRNKQLGLPPEDTSHLFDLIDEE